MFRRERGGFAGLEATLSASVSTGGADGGKFGVGKELGSLSVSVPDIELTDQTIDAANRLTATTADFAPASKADRDRQIANLTFDIAGLLGPQLGIPAGKYTVDLGPLSLGAQLLSYNIETLLGLTQTVEVTPAITSTAVTFSSPVTINGSQTTMHSFVPGERFDVDPVNNNSPVTVTPSMRLQNTFHNDVGLDITMNGIFEALSLSLSAFGSDFVDVGPLIRDVHNLGNIDIGSVFDRTFNLDTEPVTGFESFQIGAGQDKESAPTDGDTPTTAFFARPDNGDEAEFVVTPQVNDSLDEYFVSVPLNNGDGASYSGVAFTVRGDGSSQLNAVSVAHPGIRLIPNSSSGGGFIMEPGQWYPAQWFQMVVTETAQLEGDLLFGIRSWGGTAEVSWLDRVDPPPVPAVGTTGDEIDAAELRAANDQLTTELSDSDEALDVDGDGTTDALTDGQLIIRYANGQRGEALVNGLVSPNASRDTAAIEQHLAALMAEPDRLNLNDDANAFDLNTDGRLLLQVMAGSDAEVPEDVIKRLRGGRTSGIDTTRLSNSGFVSRTSGDVIGPQADSSAEEAAVPGASALNPLKLNGNSNNRSVELTGFSQATAFRETYVHSADDVTQRTLVARGAVGTPQKPTGVGPDDPTDQDSILEFSRRLQTETTTATLGVEEPIYVAMPLADQWEIEAPAGTTISGLVFDNSAGDNGYFDFQRPADESDVDFEIFLPDSDQRFNVMMSNEGQVIPLPDVQRFVLLRNGLPLAAQRGVPADEVRFLNLSLGMQLASNDPAPRLNVTLTNPVPEPPAPPTPDQGQAITLTVDRDVVQFGQQVNVAPLYHVTGTPASGPGALTFRVHYDSSRFTFENGSSNFSSFDTIRDVAETVPDGDLNTDRTVELSWFDPTGSELNNTTPEEIVNLVFTANTEAGTTSFHATRSDSAVWDFTSTSAAVDVTPITFVVDNVGDVSDGNFSSGQLTLREAIEQATAGGGGSRIEFSEQLSQITLSDQLPEIQSDITITGPGADLLTINAASSRRHLYVFNEGTLTLSGVTLQGGNVVGSTLDSAGSLLNAGVTKLDGVRLIDNSARFGGAVANIGTLRISNSELSGNHATSSGGAASLGEDVLIVNSTISGNTSDGNAGGLSVEDGTIVVRNSTIVGNRSNADGANGGTAGGIHQISSGQVTLHNTIVAGNREVLNGGIGDIPCDIVGVVQPESSHNLVTDPNTSGGLSAANGNIIGNGSGAVLPLATVVESQLTGEGPRSHVLAANSPAIDAGSNAQVFDVNDQFVLSADQTGAARVFGGPIDIGAVENVPLAAFTVTPPQSDNVTEAGSTTTASVVLNAPPTGNVVFSIDSSDIGEAVVSPAILTFSPGNWDQPQSLTITGVDDSVADGDRASSITLAVSEGPDAFTVLLSQSFNVVTRDDEVAQLTVTIDSDSIVESEGSHAAMATVTRNSDTSEELRVNIVSSDTSEVIAPTPIIIPAGQTTSGPFLVSAVDDSDVDGTQTVTLTASAPGHAEGTDTIVVIDDDTNARPGNIDGDDDFDASDTFLIQLVQLSGNNQQIDQTKGASPRTAEEIRAAIAQLATTGDVDGDNHFDANDAFLIHLVQLSGTNAAIDQSKGASPLSAAEIRANIEELGGRNNQQSASQPIHQVTLHAYNAIHRTIPPTLFDWDESQRSDVAAGKFSNQIDRPLYDEVLSDFRSWVDVL